ncbi:DUF4238 domain-containing protein [Portibacter marinus]|uniref:DUF4238 domain-containing protein n=1 Tax=Portibacter marinus TaxID=2898660 RepID=UPI001F1CAA37|nr:DUF4238 domain-containing protein [Portibacter marinus]
MPAHKNQHLIPQVYLKQFGFKKQFTKGKKWFVSVKNLETKKWEDREIKKFLAENHAFTLENYKEIHELIIEKDLNSRIEARIPKVIKQLQDGELTENIQLAIAETTANLLCRTKALRNWLKGWLKRDDFRDFFDIIVEFEGLSDDEKDSIFNSYISMSQKDAVNSLMVAYMNHTSKQLRSASIEVLKGSNEAQYFTSDNPVVLMNDIGYGQIGKKEMEIYFPLSNTILIRFYWHDKDHPEERVIKEVSKEEYDYFHREVLIYSADKFIISPIEKSLLGR